MPTMYDQLQAGDQQYRRNMAEMLVAEMCGPGPFTLANEAYNDLCNTVITRHRLQQHINPVDLDLGVFTAEESCNLILNKKRVRGFLQAIERTEGILEAVEAGCGASVILSAG